jgi:hypothetical protein
MSSTAGLSSPFSTPRASRDSSAVSTTTTPIISNVYKRVYIAPIGFSDVTLDAGYLSGNLPFPLLVIHPANQSFFYTENAYNLMNIGEFVSDHYAGINIDHFFGGFFFNKVPGLKRLKLREVVAAKILYGGLRDENNPAFNPNQMKFPLTNGVASTYVLGAKTLCRSKCRHLQYPFRLPAGPGETFHLPRPSQYLQPRPPREYELQFLITPQYSAERKLFTGFASAARTA